MLTSSLQRVLEILFPKYAAMDNGLIGMDNELTELHMYDLGLIQYIIHR